MGQGRTLRAAEKQGVHASAGPASEAIRNLRKSGDSGLFD